MNGRGIRMGAGSASMLMIIIILFMTTLGMLALMSARADAAMTNNSRRLLEDYYSAASQAQRIIMEIDDELAAAQKLPSHQEYAAAIRDISLPGVQLDIDKNTISFSVDAQQRRQINITLEIADYGAGFGEERHRYKTLRHTLESDDMFGESDDELRLFQGGE